MAYDPLDVATVYLATFAPRTDVYSASTPEGWRPVREPLTPKVLLAGLSGKGPSISAYMIAPGSVSHVLAFDFDTDDGLEQGLTLARFMNTQGLPAYVETSRRGSHLWAPIDEPTSAKNLRWAARALLQASGLPDNDPHIEIRPGSDRIDAAWHEGAVVGTGLGHALRLPLMPHPKTGKRGKLLFDGKPMGNSVPGILLEIGTSSVSDIIDWAGRWKRPPVEKLPPSHRNPRERLDDDGASASELLRSLWGALDATPGKVISCPAKGYHSHGDIHKGCRVFPDDRRVMCHKTGCILNNDGRGRGTYELRKLAPGAE